MMIKRRKTVVAGLLMLLCLLFSALPVSAETLASAGTSTMPSTKYKLSATKYTIHVDGAFHLYLDGADPRYVWWETSNPDVATVLWTGEVEAHKKGTTVITAQYNGQEFNCSVKVVQPRFVNNRNYQVIHVKKNGVAILSYKQGDRLFWQSSKKNLVSFQAQKDRIIIYAGKKSGTCMLSGLFQPDLYDSGIGYAINCKVIVDK